MNSRAQIATEYLLTYGLMGVIIVAVLAVLFAFGVFGNPASVALPSINGFAGGLQVTGAAANTSAFEFAIANNVGLSANLTNVSISVAGTTYRNFFCNNPLLSPGQNTTCLLFGSFKNIPTTINVVLNYTISSTSNLYASSFGSVFLTPTSSVLPYQFPQNYVNITITSPDGATSANFQQEITFNPTLFAGYEQSNLGNIRFYNKTTELYSWCESGCSSLANQSIFWVKLANPLPAGKAVNITMVFQKPSNYDGVFAGEAPQLSPVYGQYDNGVRVFSFYDNFAGSTLNSSKWSSSASAGASVTVNNGVTFTIPGGDSGDLLMKSSFSRPWIFGALVNPGPAACNTLSINWNQQNSAYGGSTGFWSYQIYAFDYRAASTYFSDYYWNGTIWSTLSQSPTIFSTGTWYNIEQTTADSSILGSLNGIQIMSSGDNSQLGPGYIGLVADSSTPACGTGTVTSTDKVQYAYMRVYPPNGVMPTANVGTFKSVIININNTQSSATPAPFQQVLRLNSLTYNAYESPDLKNIEFTYTNGTIIDSWLESGNLAFMKGSGNMILPNMTLYKDITIAGWFKATNLSAPGNRVSTGTIFAASPQKTAVALGLSNGKACVQNKNGTIQICSNITVVNGNWYQVVAVVGVDGAAIYVNGRLAGYSSTGWSEQLGVTNLVKIGNSVNFGYGPFDGMLADIQLYNGSLTGYEVNELYLEGMGGSPITSVGAALVGWWKLSGNSLDSGPNGYNAKTNTSIAFIGAGSGSTNTTYWLKLPSGIAANGGVQIKVNFLPTFESAFNNITTGEAPQLSPIYGQYDDGADVFNFYDNFIGTTLSSKWVNNGESTLAVNNGLNLSAGNTASVATGATTSLTIPTNYYGKSYIAETEIEEFPDTDIFDGFGLTVLNSTSATAYNVGDTIEDRLEFPSSSGSSVYDIYQNPLNTVTQVGFNVKWYNSTFFILGMAVTGNSFSGTFNYKNMTVIHTNYGSSAQYPGLNSWRYSTPRIYWYRIRAYPPNGVMPSQNAVSQASIPSPANVQYSMPMTIINNQSSSVTNFQQRINVPLSLYSPYANLTGTKSFQNVEFSYANGTVIPSWLESYNSSNALWWVKLASLQSTSSITIYMDFAPKTTNLFNTKNVGEAPTLSASYGQYDDGANVFSAYTNFTGPSASTGWVSISNATTTRISSGLNITWAGHGQYAYIYYNTQLTYPLVLDAYVRSYLVTAGSPSIPLVAETTSTTLNSCGGAYTCDDLSGTGYATSITASGPGSDIEIANNAGGSAGSFVSTFNESNHNGTVSLAWVATGSEKAYTNYKLVYSATDSSQTIGNYYISVGGGTGSSTGKAFIQWLRARVYPPNGVMPTVTFGVTPVVFKPAYVQQYVPVTITNNQNTSVANFQQLLTIPSSVYTGYADSNFQNVEFFYANGTVIPSWLENYTSSSALWWTKLSYLPAQAAVIIYMGFAPKTTNLFNNKTVGEAAQLSPSYGQYDDGAKIFAIYDNFSGSVINTGRWATSADGAFSQSNGVTASQASGFSWINTNSPSYCAEAGVLVSSVSFNSGFGYLSFYNLSITGPKNAVLFSTAGDFTTTNSCNNLYPTFLIDTDNMNGAYRLNAAFVGTYPPNGIMPTASFGQVSSSALPTNIQVDIPVTITNNQSVSESNFQQEINVPYLTYSPYANLTGTHSLQNVEFFYPNGTIIPSWLENYTLSNALWWIKLPSVPAFSTFTVYMGFASKTTNLFNNITTGEAPQLSASYGQYDDGANLFTSYLRWGGLSALPSGWSEVSTPTVWFNSTFLTVTGTSSTQQGIQESLTTPTAPFVSDAYGDFFYAFSTNNVPWVSYSNSGFGLNYYTYGNGLTAGGAAGTIKINLTNTLAVYSGVYPAAGTGTELINYVSDATASGGSYTNGGYFGYEVYGAGVQYRIYWSRTRVYPPNGVMPTVKIGQSSTITLPANIPQYIPITITNNQNTTVLNFQQQINAPYSVYSNYANLSGTYTMQNVEFFYANGTVIPSWLENYTSSGASWWIKIPSMPAYTSFTVYMGFASKTTNLFNSNNVGEAPDLSPTYAAYDDGASVFSLYINGNTTISNAVFSTMSGVTLTQVHVAAGPYGRGVYALNLSFNTHPTIMSFIYNKSGATVPSSTSYIEEDWFKSPLASNTGLLGLGNAPLATTYNGTAGTGLPGTYVIGLFTTSHGQIETAQENSGAGSTKAAPLTMPNLTANLWYSGQLTYVAGGASFKADVGKTLYQNFTYVQSNANHMLTTTNLYIAVYASHTGVTKGTALFDWVRVRVYPPNGVMPTASFGQTSSVTSPPYVQQYVPVTVTNNQNTSVANFQQLLTIPSSVYTGYADSNFQNVEFFYANGTVIPSWLESYNSSDAAWWVKIAYLPAYTATTIFMGFAPSTANIVNTQNIGEAPTLSPGYGQYDDGANVFGLYTNFTGPSLTSPFAFTSCKPGGIYTVSDGLIISTNSSDNCAEVYNSVATTIPFPASVYADVVYFNNVQWPGLALYPNAVNDGVGLHHGGLDIGGAGGSGLQTTRIGPGLTPGIMGITWLSNTSEEVWINETPTLLNARFLNITTQKVGIGVGEANSAPSTTVTYQYARIQVAPPNGVMPTASFGQVASISTPVNIQQYVPVTITNTQNVSATNFQQWIKSPYSVYSSYAASNLQNVEFFYPNSTIIPSWLETYNSSYAVWWIKVPYISAESSITVYMGFVPKTTNLFNNKTIGEAPQLSGSYGQYDNGANIFNAYWNFSGTTVNSAVWTASTRVKQNNGLVLLANATSAFNPQITSVASYPSYSDALNLLFYDNYSGGSSTHPSWSMGSGDFVEGAGYGTGYGPGYYNGTTYTQPGSAAITVAVSTPVLYSVYTSAKGIYYSFDNLPFSFYSPSIKYNAFNSGTLSFFEQSSAVALFVQYAFVTTLPPNGVMPAVNFGATASLPVTFMEAGLPSGATWNVTYNGVTKTSTTTNVTFSAPVTTSGSYKIYTQIKTSQGNCYLKTGYSPTKSSSAVDGGSYVPVTFSNSSLGCTLAYVSSLSGNTVTVINTSSNAIVGSAIPVGAAPFGAAVTPNGKFVYVANSNAGTVSILNTSSNKDNVKNVTLFHDPNAVVITPNGKVAYVSAASPHNVYAINTTSYNIIANISVGAAGSAPYGLAITPNGKTLYVALSGGHGVAVINTTSNSVLVANISTGINPWGVAITPNGNFTYVTNYGSNTTSVISTISNTVSTSIPVGQQPVGIAINPNGKAAYVSNHLSSTVSVLNLTTNKDNIINISTFGGVDLNYGITVNPNGKLLYVSAAAINVINATSYKDNIGNITITSPVNTAISNAGGI